LAVISLLAAALTSSAHAQAVTEPPAESPEAPASSQSGEAGEEGAAEPTTTEAPAASHDSVTARLDERRAPLDGLFELPPLSFLERAWRETNDKLEEGIGLRFEIAYTLSFQAATSGPGDRSGAEGDLDLFGAWRLVGDHDGPDVGTLNLNAQHIHDFGETAPANLSDDIGAAWATSDGIGSNESFPVVQLYYEQRLLDDRILVSLGKIDTTNYVGTNRFADDTLFFMNRAFSSNPAINYPGNGLGAVIACAISEEFYLGACIADANGVETQSGFDSIGAGDFFLAAEAGLTLKIGDLGEGNYRLTVWHSDNASEVDLPEDYGVALSIDQEVGGGLVPFFKYAWSDGEATGVRNIVAGGIGLEGPFGREDDVLGAALSWGESTDASLGEQVVAEVFYRLQLAANIQWTLGGQAVFDALDSDSGEGETVGILEVRLRVTF
jgi:hypothetical protein